MKKQLFCSILCILTLSAQAMPLSTYNQRPKLVVVIVIDQFRADFLTRLHPRFKKNAGFDLLMNQGAYFPFARYDLLQSMTGPGHATILTGAHPEISGIPLNEWWDAKEKRMSYCVEDKDFGLSPKNLKSTTVSDEYKLVHKKSKVFSFSLKDRSAILLGGHHADLSAWYNAKTSQWESSAYYAKNLPSWMLEANETLRKEKGQEYIWKTAAFEKRAEKGSKAALSLAYGTEILMNLAETALQKENLGKNAGTDFLFISLSNHDFVGHAQGPTSQQIEELTLVEDQQIAHLLALVKKNLGSLKNVTVALTADHGVSPLVDDLKAAKIEAGKIDYLALYKSINEKLDEDFGSPKNKEWIAASQSFHFYLNQESLKEKKLSSELVENKIREVLLKQNGVWKVFTKADYAKKDFPVGKLGEDLKNQYIPGLSGDVILIPRPYFMEKDENTTTHMTGFSYDAQVPLIIFDSKVKAGVYSSPASMVDLAPTLSFILGATAPAGSVGKVLPIFD